MMDDKAELAATEEGMLEAMALPAEELAATKAQAGAEEQAGELTWAQGELRRLARAQEIALARAKSALAAYEKASQEAIGPVGRAAGGVPGGSED